MQKEYAPHTITANDTSSQLRELFDARELLLTWTRREFRVRYSQSILGAAWAVLQPLTLMIIFSVVFGYLLNVPTEGVPVPVFSYTGTLPWTFFANSVTFAVPSLVSNMTLVSKIRFPREILPLAAVLVSMVDFAIGALLLIPLMALYQVPIGWTVILVPLIVLVQVIFTYALALFGSAINVFFRDVRFIIPLMLQVWLYISPVIYPVSQVPSQLQPIFFLNPMAVLIDSYRRVILFQQPPNWLLLGVTALESLVLMMLAYRIFKRAERRFADVI